MEIAHRVVELLRVRVEEAENAILFHADVHVLEDDPQDPSLLLRRRARVQRQEYRALRVGGLSRRQLVQLRIQLSNGDGATDLHAAILDDGVDHLGKITLLVTLKSVCWLLPVEHRQRILG